MRLITWKFADLRNTHLVIGEHVLIQKGLWSGYLFSLEGLGLSKAERKFFNAKFLQIRNVISLYLGCIVISIDKRGAKEHLSNVRIIKEIPLKQALKQALKEKFNKMVLGIQERYHDLLNRRQFKTVHNFMICRSFEGYYSFKSDMLSAFQLASNYEADLYLGRSIIYSPLGFEYEYNLSQVEKHLGKRFITKEDGYTLRGYKDPYSPEIQEFKRVD